MVTSYKDKKGKRKVTGKPKELKQSQEYPPAFGQAVYQSFMATKPDVHTWNLLDYDVDVTDDERDTWPDALNGLQPAQLFHVATTFKEPWSFFECRAVYSLSREVARDLVVFS